MVFSRRPSPRFNRGRIASGAPGFSPANIADLVANIDMLDSSGFATTSGNVSSLTNKASGAVWTVATNRPAYNAAILGGKPGMVFNGTSSRVIQTEAAVLAALSGPCTIFYVAEFDTMSRDEALIATGNSATSLGIRSWGQNTTGDGRWAMTTLTDAGASVVSTSTAKSQPGPLVHCWRPNGTTVANQINKGVKDPAASAHAPGTTNSDRFAIGCRPRSSPTLHFDGNLGQLLIYSRVLTDEEVAQVVDWLYTRWGITPLQHVLTQGDSITAGNTAGAVSIASLLSVPGAIITNVATGGRKATEVLATDIDAEMVQFRSTGNVVAYSAPGSNDLATGDGTPGNYATPEQLLTTLEAIATRYRELQITSVAGNITYRQSGGWGNNPAYNTAADTVKAAMKVGYTQVSTYVWVNDGTGKYGEYVIDVNAALVDAGGFALYIDNTHPNPTGTAAMAAPVQEGIDLALAA